MNQPDRSDIAIESLAEKIAFSAREMSAEIDRDRRLPDELVTLLREAGLLRAGMPREVQAPELAPGLALRCAEAVARGNASAGWCVSIAITSSLLVGYLPESS
ncbi:MAG TPA: acyl-CoA dehydrogenase family protein, partial [Mycobacterium sp.]|nr:acyl-CoA dehydrogenase family protein [Mycobacterium sp.]